MGDFVNTVTGRGMREMIMEFKEHSKKFYALVVDYKTNEDFDFSQINSYNFKVFVSTSMLTTEAVVELEGAKHWLLEQI